MCYIVLGGGSRCCSVWIPCIFSTRAPTVMWLQAIAGLSLLEGFGLHQIHLPSLMPNLITQFRRHYASRPGICQYVDWETTVDIKAFFFFFFLSGLETSISVYRQILWHQPLQELPAGSMIEMKFILEIAFGIKWFVVKLHFFQDGCFWTNWPFLKVEWFMFC